MSRYIAGGDRTPSVLFPERLDDWVEQDNAVQVVDVFVDACAARLRSSAQSERSRATAALMAAARSRVYT